MLAAQNHFAPVRRGEQRLVVPDRIPSHWTVDRPSDIDALAGRHVAAAYGFAMAEVVWFADEIELMRSGHLEDDVRN